MTIVPILEEKGKEFFMTAKNFYFPVLSVALLLSGCFAHKEAPERHVTARGLEEAQKLAAEVQRVDLTNSKQGSVPTSLQTMPKLEILYLAGSTYTNFTALSSLQNLKVLDLSFIKMTQAPKELASLKSLRDLYLGSCAINTFPEYLAELPSLRYINLDRNNLTKLPSKLPPALKWLRLNENKLTALPNEIDALTQLQRIYLRNNRLTTLPETLSACTEIEDINLANNDLSEFPKVLLTLPKLRNLDLSGNVKLSKLPNNEELAKMTSLRTLILRGTGLTLTEEDRQKIRAALHHTCVVIF